MLLALWTNITILNATLYLRRVNFCDHWQIIYCSGDVTVEWRVREPLTTVITESYEPEQKKFDLVYDPLKDLHGSVSAEQGIGLGKKPYLSFSRSEAEIDLMRRMKVMMDSDGVLNPGKLFDV